MTGKVEAVIFDLDGTVALHHNPDGSQRRGHFEYSKVSEDLPNIPVINIVQILSKIWQPIAVTGRMDENNVRTDTINWIYKQMSMSGFPLLMREDGDYGKDYIIKEEIYFRYVEPYYDIKLVLDDRNQVVDMWRRLGLTCFQVAAGDF